MVKHNILKASVYVTTCYNYSIGDGSGKQFNLADYNSKEKFIEACKAYHNSADLFFPCYENIFTCKMSEYNVPAFLWELINIAKEIEEPEELEAFNAWLNVEEENLECYIEREIDIYDLFRSQWRGKYENLETFYNVFLVENGYFDKIPEPLRTEIIRYFDFESYARDEELNKDVSIQNEHVFLRYSF